MNIEDDIEMKPSSAITEDDVVERYLVALDKPDKTSWFLAPHTICDEAADASYLDEDEAAEVAAKFEDSNFTEAHIVPAKVAGMFIVSVDGELTESGRDLLG